jgi:hypothetical protein
MKRNKLFTLAILLLLGQASFAQRTTGRYLVFTFEDTYKRSSHGTVRYYWILPQDSVDMKNNDLSLLLTDYFSRNNLEDCCNGKPIDPLFIPDKNISFDFDPGYMEGLAKLKKIISKNRRKQQQININWTDDGNWQKIQVFITPVSGNFCSSDFHVAGQQRTGYKGKVYVPLSGFVYDEQFWSSPKAKTITLRDFSKMNFSIRTW